jgi:DsbC/DsbD-like thiol-disulfide interchange protein
MISSCLRNVAAAFAFLLALAASHAALALESEWFDTGHAQARLIADAGGDGPRAGIEIRLEKGWKTYWRYPGDAGVPPRFDWSGSENLQSVKVEWPAPAMFVDDSGSKSIGYHDRVVFPVSIAPADVGQPIKLRLKLDFAVCEKLCVPAQAEMSLMIPVESGDLSEALEQAIATVPQHAILGQNADKPNALAVMNIRIEHGNKPRAIIEIKAPAGSNPQLFAEGPDEQWALPLPEKLGEEDGLTRFSLAFSGAPPGARPIPPKLILTLAAEGGAREVEIPLE